MLSCVSMKNCFPYLGSNPTLYSSFQALAGGVKIENDILEVDEYIKIGTENKKFVKVLNKLVLDGGNSLRSKMEKCTEDKAINQAYRWLRRTDSSQEITNPQKVILKFLFQMYKSDKELCLQDLIADYNTAVSKKKVGTLFGPGTTEADSILSTQSSQLSVKPNSSPRSTTMHGDATSNEVRQQFTQLISPPTVPMPKKADDKSESPGDADLGTAAVATNHEIEVVNQNGSLSTGEEIDLTNEELNLYNNLATGVIEYSELNKSDFTIYNNLIGKLKNTTYPPINREHLDEFHEEYNKIFPQDQQV